MIMITGQKPILTARQARFQIVDMVGRNPAISQSCSSLPSRANSESWLTARKRTFCSAPIPAIHATPAALRNGLCAKGRSGNSGAARFRSGAPRCVDTVGSCYRLGVLVLGIEDGGVRGSGLMQEVLFCSSA